MPDITQLADEHKHLPEDEQKKAGQALGGDMKAGHEEFMLELVGMIDGGEIDVLNTESFLNMMAYQALPELDRSQVDVSLLNIADQTRHIYEFYKSEKTPNASPHLETMIEHLWQMKSKLEERFGNVLKV